MKNFVQNPSSDTLTKTGKNGNIYFYDTKTNTLGITKADGTPASMFKPNPDKHGFKNNMEYFNEQ